MHPYYNTVGVRGGPTRRYTGLAAAAFFNLGLLAKLPVIEADFAYIQAGELSVSGE